MTDQVREAMRRYRLHLDKCVGHFTSSECPYQSDEDMAVAADDCQLLAAAYVREHTFTKDVPTDAGGYWWRQTPLSHTQIVYVGLDIGLDELRALFSGFTESDSLADLGGEWCPISKPE